MRVRDSAGRVREGRAIDLPGADPTALARAIEARESSASPDGGGDPDPSPEESEDPPGEEPRDPPGEKPTDPPGEKPADPHGERAEEPDAGVAVEAPAPGPVHEHVSPVTPGSHVPVRAALAAAARTRGLSAPQDPDLEATREELSGLDPEPVDASEARRRVAEAGDREDELHERVAEIRGRLRGREAAGLDASDERERLEEVARELSAVRTDRIAAEQALGRARERARSARETRERRLRLEDRLGNLRRVAREHLAGELAGEFRAALRAVPGEGRIDGRPADFEGDPVTAALAVVRVADLAAPVVLACDRFPDAETAADALGAPVIRV